MPYTPEKERIQIDQGIIPFTPGQLTYKLYRTSLTYLGKKFSFADVAIVMGCLLCTILELYRRKAAPYEDEKIKQNGDVL